MNKVQFEQLSNKSSNASSLSVGELAHSTNRTLIWGYTCERHSFHVYLEDAVLHRLIYDHDEQTIDHIHGGMLEISDLIPDKRVYPEASDFEFCNILTNKGFAIPFTSYNEDREPAQYYGKKVDTLTPTPEVEIEFRKLHNDAQEAIRDHYIEQKGLSEDDFPWDDEDISKSTDIVRKLAFSMRDGRPPRSEDNERVNDLISKLEKGLQSSHSERAVTLIRRVMAVVNENWTP